MKKFTKDNTITHFSSDMDANYTIDLEDTIQVKTYDCYGRQVYNEKVLRSDIDMNIMNQATGPFYVNRLKKQDVLKIDIQDITLDDYGIMLTIEGLGILGEEVTGPETKLFSVKNNNIHLNENLHIPARPMIGVIGTAPRQEVFIMRFQEVMEGTSTQKMLRQTILFIYQFSKMEAYSHWVICMHPWGTER